MRHNAVVLLRDLVRTSEAVAATPRRGTKIAEIASLLREASPAEVPVVAAFLSGELTQRQIGVGYAAIAELLAGLGPAQDDNPAQDGAPALTISETDAVFADVGAVTGAGSQAARRRLLATLFGRATPGEREFLSRLLAGELHQGALEGVMVEAVARAAGVPAAEVRRAHLLGGSLPAVTSAALTAAASAATAPGPPGPTTAPGATGTADAAASAASAALPSFGLEVGRPLRQVLASSAGSVPAAFARVSPAAVEWKIDGIRVQVHVDGEQVRVFTRTLDDITSRVPAIVAMARRLGVRSAVIDGEAVALRPDGRPYPFQVTSARVASQAAPPTAGDAASRGPVPLTAFLFDLLHVDGSDLMDLPAGDRFTQLAAIAPPGLLIPRIVTAQPEQAADFFAQAIAAGHEGLVAKSVDAPYRAGRRGRSRRRAFRTCSSPRPSGSSWTPCWPDWPATTCGSLEPSAALTSAIPSRTRSPTSALPPWPARTS